MRLALNRASIVAVLTLLISLGFSSPASAQQKQIPYAPIDAQLDSWIAIALREQPRLELLASKIDEHSLASKGHAGLPDPTLSYRLFGSSPETRVGPQRHALEFRQPLGWKGERQTAAARDRHLAEAGRWTLVAEQRRLIAELKRQYLEIAYLQEALYVITEEREVMGRFERITLERYANGRGDQQSVIKVQTELSRLAERRLALSQRLDQRRDRIAYLIGQPTAPLELATIELPRLTPPLSLAHWSEANAEDLPESRANIEQRAAQQRRAEQLEFARKPNLSVGVGWIEVGDRDDAAGRLSPPPDNGQDIFSLSLGVRLPTHRKRTAAQVEAVRAGERRQLSELDVFESERRHALRDAETRFSSLGERISLFGEAIVPQAARTLSSAEAAYSTGRLGFLDLLDAQRVTFQTRLAQHRLEVDRWLAAVDIELHSGLPFPSRGESK
jgi:outer membrane protein TolC